MQHFLSKALFISLVLIGLASCSGDSEEVKKAFYYWKASDLNNYESHFFEEANAEKLYVKIFEITNSDLGLDPNEIGLDGSFTRVVRIFEPDTHEAGEVVEGSTEELVEAIYYKLLECKVI